MNILVTGGAGFIGSALVRRLVEANHEVTYLDNFSVPNQTELQKARVADLCTGATGLNLDIADLAALKQLFSANKFDVVYHLAAKPGVRESISNPYIYGNTNYQGSLNILEMVKLHKVPHLVLASTSSVYGVNNIAPFKETDNVDQPVSVYAATKRGMEILANTYAQMYQLNISVLRFFTVYGPYGRPDMAPFIFTDSIIKGKPIEVFNHGNQKRDFTYIEDIVEGCVAVINNKHNGYQVFNLGSGKPIDLMYFISTIEKLAGKKADIKMTEAQLGDVFETAADISKAKQELSYSPKTSIEDGLKHYIDWFLRFYNI